ncbi:MAG: hypothetical protein CL796_01930 [Chloroflexi bacterium]|nr:hypothetical protein [Chloroflexota bacterium]|tara:strand:+ start:6963 stop:7709 length:747 start_codon:yes stop_codon:yes gene_type:complete
MNTNFPAKKKLLETEIVKIDYLSDLMIKVWIKKPDEYNFKPGQYCTLGVNGIERAYSIASAPSEELIELFIELVEEEEGGILTPVIWNMKKGDIFTMRPKAKGIFQIKDKTLNNYLLISTVTGVVPYVSFARTYLENNDSDMKFHILQGSSYVDEFGYFEELNELANIHKNNLKYVPTISRPDESRNKSWKGSVGRVNMIVDKYVLDNNLKPDNTIVFACGNPDMIIDIQRNLEDKKGFQVIEERFWK